MVEPWVRGEVATFGGHMSEQGSRTSPTGAAPGRSLAAALFTGHLVLIVFSTVAMVTILDGPPAPWLAEEPNATVMRIAWRFSGPVYVVLGALAALVHAAGRLGARRALVLFLAASSISLGAELLGTSTGFPFGEYHYTPLLGYRVAGLVPFPIPISWFYMIYACLAMTGRVLPVPATSRGRWGWAVVAGIMLVAWDVSMDPAMVKTAHWLWGDGQLFRDLGFPSWIVAFFSRDLFYGMPLANWFGWLLTGTIIARVLLAIAPPARIAERVSPTSLPMLLYAANGVMPIALCVRDELWWAAGLGALAMALPVVLALRSTRDSHGATRASYVLPVTSSRA
jgi:putative membrane protein